ncbi:hypothetical protein P3S67_004381 [Capsicum chacoense]
MNILEYEEAKRVERHELLERWRSRFSMAGFKPYPLSSSINATIKTLLENYYRSYTLDMKNGVLYFGWMNRDESQFGCFLCLEIVILPEV